MISSNDFKTGTTIEWDNDVFTIVDFQHVKPGKGSAFVRTKMKSLRTGNNREHTFRAGEKVPRADIRKKNMQYIYPDGDKYAFMDNSTYEQIEIHGDTLGDKVLKYLKEGFDCEILFHDETIIGVDPPNFVELEITETDPGLKGDTASGGTKPATLETGAVVQVPLFVNQGEKIKVDTRTDSYLERVK